MFCSITVYTAVTLKSDVRNDLLYVELKSETISFNILTHSGTGIILSPKHKNHQFDSGPENSIRPSKQFLRAIRTPFSQAFTRVSGPLTATTNLPHRPV